MNWKEPSRDYLFLSLPQLSNKKNVILDPIIQQDILTKVEVDAAFIDVWGNGPEGGGSSANFSCNIHDFSGVL